MSSDPQDEFDPYTPMSASPSGLSLAYWETEAGQEELEARIAAWEAEQDRAAEAEALAAQEPRPPAPPRHCIWQWARSRSDCLSVRRRRWDGWRRSPK
jgi:hypothetical protein